MTAIKYSWSGDCLITEDILRPHKFKRADYRRTPSARNVCVCAHRLVSDPLPVKHILGGDVVADGRHQPSQPDDAHPAAAEWHPAACAFVTRHHLCLDSYQIVISATDGQADDNKQNKQLYMWTDICDFTSSA